MPSRPSAGRTRSTSARTSCECCTDLATVVIRSGEDLWYTGDTQNLAPQVEKAVNEYVDESHTKQIAVLPLREHDPHAQSSRTPATASTRVCGAIVIEQLVDSRAPDGLMRRKVDVVHATVRQTTQLADRTKGCSCCRSGGSFGKSRVLVTAQPAENDSRRHRASPPP